MTDLREGRDPGLPGRLLTIERDALIPLLRVRPAADFALPVPACPGWTVRDVLAHCSAVLSRVVERRFEKGVFSPEANDRDIAERAAWTDGQVVDELERGMTEAGAVLARGDGRLDAGAGLPYALDLLARYTRELDHVPLHADLDELDEPLRLGASVPGAPPARYIGDAPTLVRLYAGRSVDGRGYELAGATEAELNVFG
ncbi:maleylpyruvate isomerase family mycothiol-dependent enzyme [Streptomyces misionensis]|uniref:maleylpyruvate isomerase family mycothiol-dependent enzyme n=1 Tax=Streptomyces misionensis TaxID=67331 RepID=UPI0034045C01